MSTAERSLTLVGWVVPGTLPQRNLGRSRSRSRSNSILNHQKGGRDSQPPLEQRDDVQRRSVMIGEGRQHMLLFVDDSSDDREQTEVDRQVPLEVDIAVSGVEG